VLPLLEQFAAKYKRPGGVEKPCVEYIVPGGAGHFVKMVHNGIENGMLGSICESWSFMSEALRMGNDEIGKVFERWNEKGDLEGDIFASDSK
jgi:6-phosphogluconate dehydrogenase